jgi:hypothetical protein
MCICWDTQKKKFNLTPTAPTELLKRLRKKGEYDAVKRIKKARGGEARREGMPFYICIHLENGRNTALYCEVRRDAFDTFPWGDQRLFTKVHGNN